MEESERTLWLIAASSWGCKEQRMESSVNPHTDAGEAVVFAWRDTKLAEGEQVATCNL